MYKFSNLKNRSSVEESRKQKVFFEMLDFISGIKPNVCGTKLDQFRNELRGELIVAHNLVAYKGKERRFSGDLVMAPADDVLNFIDESESEGDLRPMLVTTLSGEIRWVLHVSEDGVFSMYSQRK